MDFDMDPTEFFIWEEFIDPGKEYQCPSCGLLMDGSCVAWNEKEGCFVCGCPDCGCVWPSEQREQGT